MQPLSYTQFCDKYSVSRGAATRAVDKLKLETTTGIKVEDLERLLKSLNINPAPAPPEALQSSALTVVPTEVTRYAPKPVASLTLTDCEVVNYDDLEASFDERVFMRKAVQLYRLEQARKKGTEEGNALAAVYEEARLLAMDKAQKKSLDRDGHFSVSS